MKCDSWIEKRAVYVNRRNTVVIPATAGMSVGKEATVYLAWGSEPDQPLVAEIVAIGDGMATVEMAGAVGVSCRADAQVLGKL